jgi:hypothetical protein
MPLLRVASVVVLGIVLMTHSGCLAVAAAGAAGAGVAYTGGDTEATVDGAPEQVARAAEQALMEMGMVVISNSASPTQAEVVARTGRDTKVDVSVEAGRGRFSRIAIRVGTWGDEALQNRILGRINDHLAIAAAPSVEQSTDN